MAKIEQVTPAKPVRVKLVNVAAYARVSTARERQLSSIAAQVSYYSRLIQSTPGWVYAGVFTDEGITGTKTSGRQGLADLMELARNGGVDIVLCKSISRLARNTLDLLPDLGHGWVSNVTLDTVTCWFSSVGRNFSALSG